MNTRLDSLAHVVRRETLKAIADLERSINDGQALLSGIIAASSGSINTDQSGGGSGSGFVEQTTGYNYATSPPTANTLFVTLDSRLDNIDAFVGVPYRAHTHDGLNTPNIPARSVSIDPAITGDASITNLETFIAQASATTNTLSCAFLVRDIHIVSSAAPAFAPDGGDAQNIHGAVQLDTGWTDIAGVLHSVQNVRTPDGTPFDLFSLHWRDRSFQPVFAIDTANRTVAYDVAVKWRHVATTSAEDIHLLVDMALLVFGR